MGNDRVMTPWDGPVPSMREWVGNGQELVILVHPREGESVVDALRRAFDPYAMGTCTVQTADGPRDVDVPAQLAGVAVIETTLVPPGEVRIAPRGDIGRGKVQP